MADMLSEQQETEFGYPYFNENAFECFEMPEQPPEHDSNNIQAVEGLCIRIPSRDALLRQLQSDGFVVVDTTDAFRDRLREVEYSDTVASAVYDSAICMQSQPDRKRKWIRVDSLKSGKRPVRVFKAVCNLWSEAFRELAQVLERSLTLRNVLGLLSGANSDAHQTSHFDCAPGSSVDPTGVGHVTALGYMEAFSLDIWPGSHLIARDYLQQKNVRSRTVPNQPTAVMTVPVDRFQILALSASALHRGVPNRSSSIKTRVSALLVDERDKEPDGEIHYYIGDKSYVDKLFMQQTFV